MVSILKPPGIDTDRRIVRTRENTLGELYPVSPGIFAIIKAPVQKSIYNLESSILALMEKNSSIFRAVDIRMFTHA